MSRFLIIDGNSLINRAFYALPLLTNSNGEYSNGVYGFTTMLIKAINEYKPSHIAVAFDYGKKTFRHNLFEMYKGTRKETPNELRGQFSILKKVLNTMGIKLIEKEGIEADDILGTMCKATDIETLILSGDKDVFQLIDDTTKVMFTKKGISDVEIIDLDSLKLNYNLTPAQVIEFKALRGDTSDNIPGVKGIGDKTAISLLEKYGDIEGVYQHIDEIKGALKDKLVDGKDMAYLSKTLATIKTDCDIDFNINECVYEYPFKKEVYKIFSEYEFKSLLKKKEYFKEIPDENEEEIPVEKTIINNIEKLKEILKYAEESEYFCLKLKPNIEFSFGSNFKYIIESEISLFASITDDEIKRLIKPILNNEKITKIFIDLRQIYYYFGTEIKGNIFDIHIAYYLLNENVKSNISVTDFIGLMKELDDKMMILGVKKIYDEIELPLVNVLYEMELNGFKIDKEMLEESSRIYNERKDELMQQIYKLAGKEFNINSPKQVQIVLFDELKLPTIYNKNKSTSFEMLSQIADSHPIVSLILEYRKIQKIVSTYIDVYRELLKQGGDIIHTIYNQTLTSTGRLSSSEPNLQNIPVRSEEGKLLRKMFISRFDGGYIMSADYNQIELRLLANFSQDPTLIDSYNNNIDIHTTTASHIFNKPLDMVTQNERRTAKAVNFGVVYGISDYGLSQNINMPQKVAKEYITSYFEKYSGVKKYLDANVDNAKKDGYAKTMFGRIRRIPELTVSNYQTRVFGERVAMNMPLQGSASDIIKIAMLKTDEALRKNNMRSLLILTIHDELILDVYPGEEELAKKVLKESMENVATLQVPLLVDISYGKTWFDTK